MDVCKLYKAICNQGDQMKTAKYFTATWCGPCKTFKPVVIELIEEGYSIEIIDLDEQQDIAAQYRISSVPTMIIEENGIEIDRFVGALPKVQVIQKLTD